MIDRAQQSALLEARVAGIWRMRAMSVVATTVGLLFVGASIDDVGPNGNLGPAWPGLVLAAVSFLLILFGGFLFLQPKGARLGPDGIVPGAIPFPCIFLGGDLGLIDSKEVTRTRYRQSDLMHSLEVRARGGRRAFFLGQKGRSDVNEVIEWLESNGIAVVGK